MSRDRELRYSGRRKLCPTPDSRLASSADSPLTTHDSQLSHPRRVSPRGAYALDVGVLIRRTARGVFVLLAQVGQSADLIDEANEEHFRRRLFDAHRERAAGEYARRRLQ